MHEIITPDFITKLKPDKNCNNYSSSLWMQLLKASSEHVQLSLSLDPVANLYSAPKPNKQTRVYGRMVYANVITKISRTDRLPNFLCNGAQLARSSAINFDNSRLTCIYSHDIACCKQFEQSNGGFLLVIDSSSLFI